MFVNSSIIRISFVQFFIAISWISTAHLCRGEQVQIRLDTVDGSGSSINTVREGEKFVLRAYVQDIRPVPEGVFAVYFDVLYDQQLGIVDGDLTYSETFPFVQTSPENALAAAGVVDEVGAIRGQKTLDGEEYWLFDLDFRAVTPGTFNLVADPADSFPQHDTLLYGVNSAIPLDEINFLGTSIEIVPEPNSIVLSGIGIVLLALVRRGRRSTPLPSRILRRRRLHSSSSFVNASSRTSSAT